MTQEEIDRLYQEAARIHERVRARADLGDPQESKGYLPEERQRLAEISLLLAGGDEQDLAFLRKNWAQRAAQAEASQAEAEAASEAVNGPPSVVSGQEAEVRSQEGT